jgi:hypothetical protein|tara:strand:- start:1463 stop:2101 length:639 start_codon:yes stop_codon:yes gene_type:complete
VIVVGCPGLRADSFLEIEVEMKASKMYGCALVVTTLCLVLSSCGGPSGPEFTRADGEAFRQIGEQWSTAFNAGDVESLVSMFAGTGAIMPPNSSTVRGHESITGYYTQMFNEGERNLEVEISEVGGEGNLGFVSGTFLNVTQIPVPVDDDEAEEDAVDEEGAEAAEPEMQENRNRGKFVIILRRLARVWKFESFIWNSDLPLPVASLPEVRN